MIHRNRFMRALCIVAIPLLLSGCGQNIFSGLAGSTEQSTDDLLKSGNFSSAKDQATQTIAELASTKGDEFQKALNQKAVAILGENRSLPQQSLGILADLKNNPSSNIVASISNVMGISPSESAVAADLLNYAYDISSSLNVTIIPDEIKTILGISSFTPKFSAMSGNNNESLSPSLNSTAQFNRGFANAIVVIKMVTRYLDISSSSDSLEVTLNSTAVGESISARDVMMYLSNPPKTAYYYSTNAVDGLTKAGILTTDQQKIFDKTKIIGTNMQSLRAIAESNDSGTFYVTDTNGTHLENSSIVFYSSDSDATREEKYLDATRRIIQAIKFKD
ncbi:hypothetical protein EB093_03960 [bacterium]|nr:hypothetical protein [bacterium]